MGGKKYVWGKRWQSVLIVVIHPFGTQNKNTKWCLAERSLLKIVKDRNNLQAENHNKTTAHTKPWNPRQSNEKKELSTAAVGQFWRVASILVELTELRVRTVS